MQLLKIKFFRQVKFSFLTTLGFKKHLSMIEERRTRRKIHLKVLWEMSRMVLDFLKKISFEWLPATMINYKFWAEICKILWTCELITWSLMLVTGEFWQIFFNLSGEIWRYCLLKIWHFADLDRKFATNMRLFMKW